MDEPSILSALRDDLRALELLPAARAPLDDRTPRAVLLATMDAREAIARLVDVLERLEGLGT